MSKWPEKEPKDWSIQDFNDAMESHDWLYFMSDDRRCYMSGLRRQQDIESAVFFLGEEAINILAEKKREIRRQIRGD